MTKKEKCSAVINLLQIYILTINVRVIQQNLDKSSHQGFSIKKGVLKNFIKFMGKHLGRQLY